MTAALVSAKDSQTQRWARCHKGGHKTEIKGIAKIETEEYFYK